MSQIIINAAQKQPIDASEDVILTPPGSIKVADKTGMDLFALRFNSADLTGTLNGAISSQGTGEYTCGILFQDNDDALLNGRLLFSSGKMAVSATGAEYASGIKGDALTISGMAGSPLSGSLKVSSKSAIAASSTGIDADVEFGSELAMNVDVKADASKGTNANATGFTGNITTQAVSDKFKLSVQAKAGTGNAFAKGLAALSVNSQLGGTLKVNADASKGANAFAFGISLPADVSEVSDKFKCTVQAKAGTGGNASATAFGALTATTLSGTISAKADASKGEKATAYGMNATTNVFGVSDKFKLTVQAKAGSESTAFGFANTTAVDAGVLAGTITIQSESKGSAKATGFNNPLQAAGVSDKFKLAVTAKSGSGEALAKGLGTTDITDGLSGRINVSAISKSGDAEALGGMLSSDTVFRTAHNVQFVVTAQTGSKAAASSAYGYVGPSGNIELEGGLAVTAKGGDSTAIGVATIEEEITGSISGVVVAVGGDAYGVSSNNNSDLTISGAVYAGNKGNAVSIAKSLGKLIGTGKSAAGLNKNADQAIFLGADSRLALNDGSVVIGDVTLETDSDLLLSSGAQLYGDINMNASGDIGITIDGMLTKAAMVNLASAGAGVFAEGSGVDITILANEATQAGRYVLLSGSDLTELSNVDFNTRFDLMGFDVYDLQVDWVLDTNSKTDTLTLVLSDAPVGSSSALLSATDFNSADRMLASSSLTDELATSGANAWKNTLIA